MNIQNNLNKILKYSIKKKNYQMDKYLQLTNTNEIYFYNKLNYVNKRNNIAKQEAGSIFDKNDDWLTDNIDIIYTRYHGIIDSSEHIIIPHNIYLILPLCCGFYNFAHIEETHFILSNILDIKKKINTDEYITVIGINNYVILKPNDTYCNIRMDISYEKYHYIPMGLNFIEDLQDNVTNEDYNELVHGLFYGNHHQIYKNLEMMEFIDIIKEQGMIFNGTYINLIIDKIKKYKRSTGKQIFLFDNFISYFLKNDFYNNINLFKEIIEEHRVSIDKIITPKFDGNIFLETYNNLTLDDFFNKITELLDYLIKQTNLNQNIMLRDKLINLIDKKIQNIIYNKSQIFNNSSKQKYINFIKNSLFNIKFSFQENNQFNLFKFNRLELNDVKIQPDDEINNYVFEDNFNEFKNNFHIHKIKYIKWLKWNLYNLYWKLSYVYSIKWVESNFYKKIINENKNLSLKNLLEYISSIIPEKKKFVFNSSCQGFDNKVCDNVKCIKNLYKNVKNKIQVSQVFNQNDISILDKLMTDMSNGKWNKPSVDEEYADIIEKYFFYFFTKILHFNQDNSNLASKILYWYFYNYNKDFIKYFINENQIFDQKYLSELKNTFIIYFNIALTNYYDYIATTQQKYVMVHHLGEKINII